MSTGRSVDDGDLDISPDRSQPYPPLQSPIPTALKHKEAIAIVGMSGKYPDAHNLTNFWDNLVQGKSAIREIPLSRFNVSDYYDPNPTALGKMYCKWLGALDEIEYFDPFFFHLSPAEAEGMDPQHRLFLEEGYKAFEDAGYNPQLLSNKKCGVYLGMMSHEYDLLLYQHNAAEMNLLGSSSAIAAARIAYLLNLKGPALAIDTACSSSLVAMHLACQALRNQEIDMALVGGVSLYLTPGSYVSMCSAGMLSPSGQCKAFDASADGFVPGEGVGAVVLKRLGDAEVGHDQISGVIIGSGMNQDGATNGITAPSVKSQIELVREIYEKYQIDPESIHYVEMHGTGTKLGDPIELEALGTVFCEKTQRKQYCAIGSVKSNIDHTSAAAGMAGLHKVLLAIKQQKLVPSLHFERPNPHFDFAASPFYVNTEVQDWKSEKSTPRRAALSSFGFSGTNAHLVIEEYIPARRDKRALRTGAVGTRTGTFGTRTGAFGTRTGAFGTRTEAVGTGLAPVRVPTIFVLSAKSKLQLKSYAQEMKHWIQVHLELVLEDIAFTLQLGRAAMNYRLAILADSREVLLQKLEKYVNDQASLGVYAAQVKRNAHVGTGVSLPYHARSENEKPLSVPAHHTLGIVGTGQRQAQFLHCQGTAELHADSSIQSLNLSATQARCQDRSLMATECYQLFHELSINYGPTLQGIEQLNIGQGEVLARLRLPAALGAQTYGEEDHMEADRGRPLSYMLHPSMLDAALQACIGLLIEQPEIQEPEARSLRTVVPFMLEELSVVAEAPQGQPVVPTEGWAWVRRASGSTTGSLFDIDVCNNEGLIVVRLRGLSMQILPSTDLLPAEPNVPARKALPVARADSTDEALRDKSIAYLKEQIGKMLNIPRTKINVAEPLTSYGLDSILVLQLAQTLRTAGLEQISTTLFFEHATIDALVEHFLSTQKDVLQRLVGSDQSVHLAVPSNESRKDRDSRSLLPGKAYPPKPHESSGNALERDIAIIGLAGRYPEAKDVQAFWELLKAGKSGIREIPPSRWDWRGYFQAEKGATDSICTRWGGFLEDIDCFDASFFRISPREAEEIDPQERLFLEVSSACIEDAGYTPAGLGEHGSVGVFVGVMNGNYPTGARYWSIANRVSFTLGLQGPSLAVDTACSSSLTALHLAVESLVSGTSACAIVGGVNLIVDPVHWVRLSEMGMLSASDQCSSFGAEADGFVDAEGVGAILIKPLKWAEADGDHIYAVIKATATNHGGKTNGYTVPNPQAQAEVIEEALERAGVDARTISYVEAHGSGTTLGDPIEIAGLMRAFENSGVRDKQYCAIGSVKSNIGHTESAVGIAGITKVVLQMRYGQLVPSLHAEVPNPQIDFRVTPFVVQQELSEWKREKGAGEGKEIPRRAGISSFGAGGSNAHVILEEYRGIHQTGARHSSYSPDGQACPDGELNSSSLHPALIVLSARTEERLNEQVRQLLAWLQKQEYVREVVEQGQDGNEGRSQSLLDNLAYTLQVGRETMQERLALLVNSLSELEEKLRKYIEGQDEEGDWYQGQVKPNDVLDLFTTGEESQKMVAAWVSNGKYGKLLAWWVKGGPVDWKQFYTLGAGSSQGPIPTAPALPQRISLPTYPFARERYWIPSAPVETRTGASPVPTAPVRPIGTGASPAPVRPIGHTMLHPLAPVTSLLVQHNISDFFGQRFSSTFSGEEFFLADHVVKGQRIMPGVVYLEMARVAVAQAMRASGTSTGATEGERILHLTNVVWVRPLAIGQQPVEVHIALELHENQEVVFTISSHTREARDEALIHSQGRAAWHAREGIMPNVDLTVVQQRCQSQISAIECYQRYRELSIDYGPSLQGLEQIVVGDGEALARLRLPVAPGVAQTQWGKAAGDGFVLHPSMLDAALQACAALLYDLQEPYFPFALEELSIAGEVPVQGWAWVHRRSGSMASPMFDIEVCDDEGRIAVRLRGLSLRMLPSTDVRSDRRDVPSAFPLDSLGLGEYTFPLVGTGLAPVRRRAFLDPFEGTARAQSMPLVGTLKLSPLWDQIVLSQQPSEGNTANRVIIVGGTSDEQRAIAEVYPSVHILEITTDTSVEKLAQQLRVSVLQALHVFWLAPHEPVGRGFTPLQLSQESILVAQQQGVLLCFRLIKALLQLGYESQTLHWTVVTRQARMLHTAETVNPTHASLLGLFGSLAKEASHWSIQQVDLPSGVSLPLAEMQRLPADPQGHGWLYRNGHWYHQILVPLDVSSFATREAYRRGGVYVVIGGAGGIGEVWSEALIRKYQAHIIWIGRRKSDAHIQAKQERLATLGPKPYYITADAADRQALQQAYQEIKRNFGQIHGVVHSAIVLEDQSLAKMDEERFKAALSAKVDVSVRLTQVFEQEPLDFVLFFSSLNAFTCNAGQSNYAAGSTFEDAFASQLGRDWPCAVKVMNWGYWGSVGVVAKPVYRERMVQAGVGSIEPTEAMEALEQLLVGPVDQMVLLKTTKTTGPMRSVAQDTQVRRGETNGGQFYLTPSAIPVGEMIQANEMRTVYPERLHSYIHSLHNYRPPLLKHTTDLDRLH